MKSKRGMVEVFEHPHFEKKNRQLFVTMMDNSFYDSKRFANMELRTFFCTSSSTQQSMGTKTVVPTNFCMFSYLLTQELHKYELLVIFAPRFLKFLVFEFTNLGTATSPRGSLYS